MGRVESKEVADKDLFKPIADSAAAAEKKLEALSAELQNIIKLQAKVAKSTKSSASGFNKLAAAETKSKNALTEKEKVDKRILVLNKKRTQVTKIQRERLAALTVEEQRRNKNAKLSAQLTNKNIQAFEKLNIKIKSLSTQYKNLVVQEGKETVASKRLRKQILQLNKARDRANTSLGQHQHKVGQYGAAVGKLRSGLAGLGLAFGVFAILRSAFGVVKSFDQATADLASVLGVATDQMGALTEQAKELGATTEFTASEVRELQIAYAKLGFTQKEIEGVTEATLQLASASGTDLNNAATIVGSTLRAFNLDVSHTQRLVDVMAKSFSSSSLDIDKFSSAMANVAPAAAAIGLTIEETTALIGTLTDAGIDASSAGTGLRNMFLQAKEQGITFDEALDKIANSSDKLGTSFDLFKKKGSTLGVILANSRDKTEGLTEKLGEAGGAAKEMADKQLDTLGGSIKLIVSVWEGWILKMNESGGVGDKLKNILKFLANNLELILDTIWLAVKAFAAYKTVTIAVTLATRAYALAQAVATKGLKAFNITAKANPFGAIAAALVLLLPLLLTFKGYMIGAGEATEELTVAEMALADVEQAVTDGLQDEQAELIAVFDALKRTTAGTKERQDALDIVNEKYDLTLQNLEDEGEFVNQLDMAYQNLIETLEQKIRVDAIRDQLTGLIKRKLFLEELLVTQEKFALASENRTDLGDFDFGEFGTSERNQANVTIQSLKDIEDAIDALQNKASITDILGGALAGGSGGGKGGGKAKDPEKIKLDQLKAFQKKQKLLLNQFESRLIREGIEKELRDKMVAQRRIELAEETGNLIVDLDFKDKAILSNFEIAYLRLVDANSIERIDIRKKESREIEDIEKQRVKKIEDLAKKEKEIWKSIRHEVASTTRMITDMYETRISLIDREIDAKDDEIAKSKEREDQLRADAKERGLDASESINEERDRQKKALKEQQDLARKKQRIEALIVGLRMLAAKIEQGEGNPVKNVKSQITNLKSFIDGAFYDGTEYTVADALGRNNVRDGHVVQIDDNESVLTGAQTRAMNIRKGGNSTDDIVNIYKGNVQRKTDSLRNSLDVKNRPNDSALLTKVDQLIKVTQSQPNQGKNTFNAMVGALQHKVGKKTYIYPVRKK